MDPTRGFFFVFLGQMEEKSRGGSSAEKVALTRESRFPLLSCAGAGLEGVVGKARKYPSFSFKVLIQGMNV